MVTVEEAREEALSKLDEGTQMLMRAHSLISQAKTILRAYK